ncbi:MAG: hypothetical protein KME05_16445 [Gloeocapsa sp. UFS-A4-WI-NPMV-4B04]|nr:hypothetical protein [Gloeocapsa sp. UFS-A4-WI-NPMV-4B04]
MSKVLNWSASTDIHTVCRRAGGRRSYNAHRQFQASWRRVQVVSFLRQWGFKHGVQRQIASALGVSEATISRDLAVLNAQSGPCQSCGKWC